METLQKVSHVGCDLHKKFTIATARDAQNRLLWRQRLEHADRPRLQAQLDTWPKGTPVIFEASFGWGWFADAVQAAQLEPHLASSRKVAAWREARGLAKSNRLDADLLSELWGQQPRWWEVWLAPPEVRDQREWLRYRMALVQIQTGLKNRIHAVLHRPRRAGAGSGPAADRPGDTRVSPNGAARAGGRAPAAAAPARRGIAYVLAYTLVAEIGRIERFPNAKHLASYSLLAPRAYDSGEPEDGPPQGRSRRAGRARRAADAEVGLH